MIDIMALSPVQLERFIHMQGIVDRQANEAAKVRALRDYYKGEHPIMLTKRQQEYLGALVEDTEFTFAHNLVRAIVDTLRERLDVSGFTVNGSGAEDAELQDDAESSAELAAMFWQWWKSSRTDAAQITLYRRALRDGKAYVIVDWDATENRPKMIVHRVDVGDLQPGIMMHRDPEDKNRVLYASRYFYTFDPLNPGETGKQRKTVYLPGEIRKYIMSKTGNWEPFQDIGDPSWPLPWVDSTGAPLGIPVIEFANPGGSEIEQIIGLQNALNKTWLDLIAAADTNGFPLLAIEYSGDGAFGAVQQDDADIEGSDEFRISPGRAIEVDNATVKRLDASNLQPMIETMWTIVQAVAGVSRTPAYYLRPVGGGDVPSGEALKQLESGLVKRAQERQLTFGQAWEDALEMAYRLAQTFGGDVPEVDPLMIQAVWTDANVRNELAQAQVGQMYQALGVPDNTIWQQVLGFTPTDIAGWKADKRRDEAVKIANVSEALRRAGLQAQRPADTTQNGNQGGNNERTGNTVP
jgi:hypothetical protein